MINRPVLCPAGSTFQNKAPNQPNFIIFFCVVSTGITESSRMQFGSFHRTNISKLNFASGKTGGTADPASSMLVKLSLRRISFSF